MFFLKWKQKEREEKAAATEAEINRLQEETLKQINKAAEQTNKVNQLIEDNPGGIVELLYYAMGNDRRER